MADQFNPSLRFWNPQKKKRWKAVNWILKQQKNNKTSVSSSFRARASCLSDSKRQMKRRSLLSRNFLCKLRIKMSRSNSTPPILNLRTLLRLRKSNIHQKTTITLEDSRRGWRKLNSKSQSLLKKEIKVFTHSKQLTSWIRTYKLSKSAS